MRTIRIKVSIFSILLVAFFALGSCTIKLIAAYDETIDKGITALQKKTEGFLLGLESNNSFPSCSYKKNMQFYLDSKVNLSSITVQQLDLLASSLDSLEELHKLKDKKSTCLSQAEIAPLRVAFNSSFTAILKLELAKKRGEE